MTNQLSRISTMKDGPKLEHLRSMYLSKIRSTIAYGCAAWFHSRRDCTVNGAKCEFKVHRKAGRDNEEGTEEDQQRNQEDDAKTSKTQVGAKCPGCGRDRDAEHRWSISPTQVARLRQIHYQALSKISGAMQDTPLTCLERLLHLEPIEVCLDRIVLAFHMKNYAQESMEALREIRQSSREVKSHVFTKSHPYTTIDDKAKEMVRLCKERIEAAKAQNLAKTAKSSQTSKASRPVAETMRMDSLPRSEAKRKCGEQWAAYCKDQSDFVKQERRIVRDTEWDNKVFQRLKPLDRPRSSLLIGCLTGFIALKSHLHKIKVILPIDPFKIASFGLTPRLEGYRIRHVRL